MLTLRYGGADLLGSGLARDAGAFFTFFLIIVTGYLAMTLFFRTVACMCPDFDYALKFAVSLSKSPCLMHRLEYQ